MKHSEQLNAISEALSKAQAVMAGAKKDAANPFFKTKYADLASCWLACKDALTGNGIAVVQGNTPHDGGVQVQTRLMHKSGQWIEDDGLFVPATKADAQGFGSALTYARRYSLCAMVGIAPEDDDGNAAAKTAPAKKDWSAPVNGDGKGINPNAGAWEAMDYESQKFLADVAHNVSSLLASDDLAGAFSYLAEQKLNTDEKAALNTRFDSKERTKMRNYMTAHPEAKAAA